VCILQHQGAINLTDRVPEDFFGIAAYFKVAKGRNSYPNIFKNGIKSQKKKTHYEGNSIKFDGFELLQESEFGDEH
jgi:hypothetical protein